MRQPVSRVELDRLFEATLRLGPCRGLIPSQPVGPHGEVVSGGVGWRPVAQVLRRAYIDPADQRSDNRSHDLVLKGEEVRHRTIVTFSPDLIACPGVDQLSRDPDAFPQPTNAALHQETHAEFAPDCLDVDALSLEAGSRVA